MNDLKTGKEEALGDAARQHLQHRLDLRRNYEQQLKELVYRYRQKQEYIFDLWSLLCESCGKANRKDSSNCEYCGKPLTKP